MDLIKRADAIKAIEQLPNAYNGWSDTYDKAYIIGTLEEVPSAEELIYEEMGKADIEAEAYAKGFKEGLEARKQGEWERIPYSFVGGFR
jgi:hypothetical protein